MGKLEHCISAKIYAVRKQYPAIKEFQRRLDVVEKELNRDHTKKKSMCDCCGKPTGRCCVNNRQKP